MTQQTLLLALIGLCAGLSAGMFGIGGGLIIVPALVFVLGFTQHKATGTSLVVLLPPVGLAAVLEYSRHGNVDWRAAIIVALALFIGAWIGAVWANKLSGPVLRLVFGIFVVFAGVYTVFSGYQKLTQARAEGGDRRESGSLKDKAGDHHKG